MYSDLAINRGAAVEVGIIIGAVGIALLGLYVFVPDGGLRMFDSLLSIWQPIMGNAPVILHSPLFEQEMIKVGPFRYVNDEEIMESLQVLSEMLGPVIGPRIPPRVEPFVPPLLLRFLQAAIDAIFGVWPYLILCLAIIALAKKTCDLLTLQKCSKEERGNVSKQLEQANKKYLDMTKANEKQAEKIVILGDALKQDTKEHLDLTKANAEKDKKIVELSDALRQRTNEIIRATERQVELRILLGQKTEGYLDIKKSHDYLSTSIKQENQKLFNMTQAYDEKTKKAAVLGYEFKRKAKELQETQKSDIDLGVLLEHKTKEYLGMKTVQEEWAEKAFEGINKDIEAENSKIRSEKNDPETQVESLKNDAKKCDTDHQAALVQIEGEYKKLKEDTQNQQERLEEESKLVKCLQEEKTKLLKQLDEKSRQMKQLEEDLTNEQREREETSEQVEQKLRENKSDQLEQLEEMGKQVKQLKDNGKEQEKKAGDREKQREKAQEELKMLQPKLQDLQTANKNLKESLDKSKGQEKKQTEEIDELKGQLKGCEEMNTSLEGEHSKSKSSQGALEEERNCLLEEAKKRDADLKQLQTRCEKIEKGRDTDLKQLHDQMEKERHADLEQLQTKCDQIEKERDMALDEVCAQKEAWRRFQQSEKQRLVDEAKNREEEKIAMMDEGNSLAASSSITPTEEGTHKPQLITEDGRDNTSEDDDAEENQDNADTPKIAGKKKRRRRRKPKDSTQASPTKTEPESPLHQFVTAPGAIAEAESEAENYPLPADETLPSGASTKYITDKKEGEEDAAAASDPDEGPSELPDNIGSPTKQRRPGRCNSRRHHKFETEKRKKKQEDKKAERKDSTEGEPEGPKGGLTRKSEEGND